jgi:glycogen debranching enzyme
MNRKYCKTLAFKTIKNNKRENLRLLAGTSNYGDMWTRDAFITSLGLFAHNKYLRLVKKVLEVQSKNLREDGLVPLRIGRKSYLTKFIFGFHSGPDGVPVYKDDKAFSEPTDSNPQFIIMSYLYLKHTNDIQFIKSISKQINKCYRYLCNNVKDNLLQGHYFHSWYDTFTFNGPDLFSNVLFVYSIKCYDILSKSIKSINYNGISQLNYNKVLKNFKDKFWNNKYLRISPKINSMETAGNSLAILFNILNKEESLKVINYIERYNLKKNKIVPVVIPKLKFKYLYKPGYLVGMQGYHNDRFWLWPHCIYLAARKKLNLENNMDNLELSIKKHKMFYENVNFKLNPIKHWFQNSEENFSESCGSYLLAIGDDIFN